MRIRLITAGIAAAVAAASSYWYFAVPTVTVAVAQQNVPIEVFGLGNVDAKVISAIGFEVGGTLVELHADARDSVQSGTLLAVLNEEQQRVGVDKAKAALAQAESALLKADADVERARAVLEERRAMNRRRQQLAQSGAVSREMADQSQRDENVARAELKQAQSTVAVAKAAVENATAAVAAENVKLKQHRLYAPFSGIVIERKKELGSVLAPGEPLFTIVDPTTRWGKMYVDEARAGGIAVGKPAKVKLRSAPDRVLDAEVVRVDVQSDRVAEERVVYVKCRSCPPTFYLGEQAEVWIHVDTLPSALLIPERSVENYDGGRGVVWIVEDQHLAKQEVTFHPKTLDGLLPIASKLPSGARVVVSDIGDLRLRARVHVVDAVGAP